MKAIGIILIVLGVIGILLGSMMYGDIGIAAIIGATAALVSGIGFLQVNKAFQQLSDR
ncbi:hypothetical protein ACFFJI_02370 [Allobacillus sp. GCM10007491]|uniref:Uncharacterized protein n=1 Tax=Allobacillus saliphilus TaxID=2912308 RepID=A0A941CVR3_9BACI|nr:hypothetical protein [Allobacillus saliphilus]MBR7554016.1 hypothetical protein [Allobacillus saliphilus]